MSKKIKCFIIASVILNVVLGGLVIGHVTHRFGGGFSERMEKVMHALPPEKQVIFKATMEQMRAEGKADWKEIGAAREATMRILKAESFDEKAYRAEVKKMQAIKQERWQRMADSIATLAKDWTPEERKALAEALQRKHHRPSHDRTEEK